MLAGGLDAREGALVRLFELPLARHCDADAGDADPAVYAAKELRTAQRAVVAELVDQTWQGNQLTAGAQFFCHDTSRRDTNTAPAP